MGLDRPKMMNGPYQASKGVSLTSPREGTGPWVPQEWPIGRMNQSKPCQDGEGLARWMRVATLGLANEGSPSRPRRGRPRRGVALPTSHGMVSHHLGSFWIGGVTGPGSFEWPPGSGLLADLFYTNWYIGSTLSELQPDERAPSPHRGWTGSLAP